MSQINKILVIAFGVQLALVALTWTTCQTKPKKEPGAKNLVDFDAGDITELQIVSKPSGDGDEPETVTVTKQGEKWVVTSADGFPAKEEKITEIIGKLIDLKAREPIATNAANHNSLDVGDKEFSRKVIVKTKSAQKSLILGSGSGSSVHVRFEGKNEVYRCAGLSVWTISSGVRTYIDTKYVKIEKDAVEAVTLTNAKGKLTFKKDAGVWTLAELPEGETLDQEKVKTFVGKAAELTLNEPIGKVAKPEYKLDGATRVDLVYTDEESPAPLNLSYTIGGQQGDKDQYYYVKADNSDYVVTVSKWSTKAMREDGVAEFVAEKDTDSDEKK